MLEYLKGQQGQLRQLEGYEPGCWINVVEPTAQEIEHLHQLLNVPNDFLHPSLDTDERSRVEKGEDCLLIIFQTSAPLGDERDILYDTVPVGIIHTKDCIVTLCSKEVPVLRDLRQSSTRHISTVKKNRLTLQIFLRSAQRFLSDLRQLNKRIDETEARLESSTRNQELLELLRLQKNLVYFMTALKSNEVIMERLRHERLFGMFPDDQELLSDVLIENLQAIEMTEIATNITSSMMDAFASVINNNVNAVMKVLAVATIAIAIPTLATGMFGMNTKLPLNTEANFSFFGIMATALLIVIALIAYLRWRRWL